MKIPITFLSLAAISLVLNLYYQKWLVDGERKNLLARQADAFEQCDWKLYEQITKELKEL